MFSDLALPSSGSSARLRVGLDVVDVRRIHESLARFGERFVRRLFSEGEIAYAMQGAQPAADEFGPDVSTDR